IVGNSRTILHTTDGGLNWSVQDSGADNSLKSVTFADGDNGWIVGGNGVILHTTDGGAQWTPQTSGVTRTLYDVEFTDAEHGWIVGTYNTILHTTDGGNSWVSSPSGWSINWNAVEFIHPDTGWIAGSGGNVLVTTNAGATWANEPTGSSNSLLAVSMVDANHGWTVGNNGVIMHYTGIIPPAHTQPNRIVTRFALAPNYPNPFNPSTTLSFYLERTGVVRLRIFDILGREVAVLTDGERTAGAHRIEWNAAAQTSGMYLAVLEAGGQRFVQKMALIR
ncbi:T9SS C-terminal target domain-containing protein, partial [candidate division KSB1 bacterium]